jgi:hypothetical protein
LHPGIAQQLLELCRAQRIAIMNQVPLAGQETLHAVRQVSANLTHPSCVGHGRNTGDLHLSRRHFHEKQH